MAPKQLLQSHLHPRRVPSLGPRMPQAMWGLDSEIVWDHIIPMTSSQSFKQCRKVILVQAY